MPTVKDAVLAFEKWLRGEEYQDIEPERRQWIINQINSGVLTGKPLVYYTEDIPDNSWGVSTYNYYTAPNHAHILQKLINEKPLNLSSKKDTSGKESTSDVTNYTDPLGNAIEDLLGIDSIMYRDEVEELAHKVCIKISDTLTKIQNDPSIVENITNGRIKGTPEMSKMRRNKLM
jgi:hypothetical protein